MDEAEGGARAGRDPGAAQHPGSGPGPVRLPDGGAGVAGGSGGGSAHDAGPVPPWAAPAGEADLAVAGSVTGAATPAGGIRAVPPAEVPPVRSAAPRPVPPSPVPLDGAPAGGPPQDGPPPDGPPRPRWGLGAYLLVEAVLLAASALIGLYSLRDGAFTAEEIVAGLAVPTVLAAGTALLITRIRGNGPRIDLGLEWSWNDVLLGLGFGLGGIVLTLPAASLYLAVAGEDSSSAVGEVFGGVTASAPVAVLALLVIAIVAPVCEEIVYRGLLWSGVERLGGRWAAFVVTTLLFALAHFEFSRTPLLLVLALPIAAARLYTGRLLASIVAHQVNNLLPGVALMLALLGVVPPA